MPPEHVELAHAKLTRFLHVVGRRPDGYHLLEAEMVSLDLADELVISDGDGLEVLEDIGYLGTACTERAASVVPVDASNLVARALELVGLRRHVRLTKRIPAGAGLGGGSSDAAAILRYAGATAPSLAARLGADVPFCVTGGRALVRGVGEVLEPLEDEEHHFVLLIPALVVSTPAVYRRYDELVAAAGRSGGVNDLEEAALSVEPALASYRSALATASGLEPVLAGSGATYFVECNAADKARLAALIESELYRAGLCAAVLTAQTTPRAR